MALQVTVAKGNKIENTPINEVEEVNEEKQDGRTGKSRSIEIKGITDNGEVRRTGGKRKYANIKGKLKKADEL